MRNPWKYLKNFIGMTGKSLVSGNHFRAGRIQTFDHLHTELYHGGQIKLGSYNQNRGDLYLIADGGTLEVGSHCFFNTGCCVTAMEKVTIGDYCKFGNNLVIVDQDHNYKAGNVAGEGNANGTPEYVTKPVVIGDHTWVGANCTILKGTTIGSHCVIAAGSVVHGNLPDHTTYVEKRVQHG